MKIAFATNGENLKARIALHFGRADKFLIYDIGEKIFEIYPNPEVSGKELPPDFLNRMGVDAVITFSLGPMAFGKLKRFGIKIYKVKEGTIFENIKLFEKEKLSPLSEKDIF